MSVLNLVATSWPPWFGALLRIALDLRRAPRTATETCNSEAEVKNMAKPGARTFWLCGIEFGAIGVPLCLPFSQTP